MAPATPFLPLLCATSLLAVSGQLLAQETGVPVRPETRILDEGSIFEAGDRSKVGKEIQGKLEALQAETGCDILVATFTSTTGTSTRALAEQFAAAWLNPATKGAVLVYGRAGNEIAISTTDSVRDTIADYVITSIEQASQDREDAEVAEVVALAANDLAAVFRKYYGQDAGRDHPAIKADRILIGVVAACIIAMTALVAALHWRGERARA